MPKVNKKTMLIIGGGAALVLLFLYMRSRSSSSTSSSTTPTDTTGTTTDQASSDYATLAGDIQQAQANEQNDIAQQQAQESGDIANLTGQIQANSAQEQSDVTGLGGLVAALGNQLNSRGVAAAQQTVTQVAAGKLRPPAGHPHAVWAGPHKPGNNWVGIGGGWWAPAPAKKNQSTKKVSTGVHVNANHPTGTAGSSVAARSHGVHRATGIHAHPKSSPPKPSKTATKRATPKKVVRSRKGTGIVKGRG